MGRDATAEAFTYAWENWERIRLMENPAGYVYRVGERAGRRLARRPEMRIDFSIPDDEQPMVEPGLAPALASLSERQRLVVVMVHALGWTHRETAEFLGLSTSSVQKHLERGLSRLRHSLGVEVDA
jgi:RNA polymerase sigma-70 factor (ECF subfamily)